MHPLSRTFITMLQKHSSSYVYLYLLISLTVCLFVCLYVSVSAVFLLEYKNRKYVYILI